MALNENELEQLQKELEDLRRKSEKRSFKQILKDGRNRVKNEFVNGPPTTLEGNIIVLFIIAAALSSILFLAMILAALLYFTDGLILLVLSIYPLYLIFRKPQ